MKTILVFGPTPIWSVGRPFANFTRRRLRVAGRARFAGVSSLLRRLNVQTIDASGSALPVGCPASGTHLADTGRLGSGAGAFKMALGGFSQALYVQRWL
jgi:hypothetical protein